MSLYAVPKFADFAFMQHHADETKEVKVQFCPRDWKTYETRLPVYLGGDKAKPYMMLEVRALPQFFVLTHEMRLPVYLGGHKANPCMMLEVRPCLCSLCSWLCPACGCALNAHTLVCLSCAP